MRSLERQRIKARTRLQYEAAECGAASLATILAYFGKVIELGELRQACGVSRDGSNAKQLLEAGRHYGLKARAYRCSGEAMPQEARFPCIIFWGFNHFLVLEGFDQSHAFLSDPAKGRIRVEMEEFLDQFTGIVLEFEPGELFEQGGRERSPLLSLPSALAPYRGSILSLLLVSSGQAILSVMVAGLTATFIDSFLQNQRLYFGIPIIWILLVTVIGWLALLATQYVVLRRMELLLSKRLTADLFRKLFQVVFAFHQARFQGEIAGRMLLGMETTQVVVAQLLRFSLSLWIGLLILLFATAISAWLSAVVLATMAANLVLNWWLTEQRYDANRKLAIEQGKSQGKGLEGINNIEAIKASGLEFDFLSQWQTSFGNVVTQSQTLGAQMAVATIAASGSTFLLNALVITLGGFLIIAGKMSLGTLVAFQFLQGQLTAPINTLPQINSTIQSLIGNLGRLDDLKTSEDDTLVRSFSMASCANSSDNPNDSLSDSRLRGDIKLENLSYSFTPVSPAFIEDLSLTIPAGTHLAIVGGSGSGKTTLIRLLAGLIQPTTGRILLDDTPWEQHSDLIIRNSIAYVPQQVFIFNASFRDNMTLWKPGYTLGELESAASDAHIINAITKYPEGFSKTLRDNGSDLSGGERQRLELSRALLRNPSIILLDEATSALDNATQSRVLDSLERRGLTVISVAHRLDAALRSDLVIVMANGAVVEQGPPHQLQEHDGYFRRLVENEQQGIVVSS